MIEDSPQAVGEAYLKAVGPWFCCPEDSCGFDHVEIESTGGKKMEAWRHKSSEELYLFLPVDQIRTVAIFLSFGNFFLSAGRIVWSVARIVSLFAIRVIGCVQGIFSIVKGLGHLAMWNFSKGSALLKKGVILVAETPLFISDCFAKLFDICMIFIATPIIALAAICASFSPLHGRRLVAKCERYLLQRAEKQQDIRYLIAKDEKNHPSKTVEEEFCRTVKQLARIFTSASQKNCFYSALCFQPLRKEKWRVLDFSEAQKA